MSKARVSLPCLGRSPARNNRSSAIAPQISLPWVSAVTRTCGPGTPLSNVVTYSIPVLPAGTARCRAGSARSHNLARARDAPGQRQDPYLARVGLLRHAGADGETCPAAGPCVNSLDGRSCKHSHVKKRACRVRLRDPGRAVAPRPSNEGVAAGLRLAAQRVELSRRFPILLPVDVLRTAEDTYVDELYSAAPALGATLIGALFPRSYLDPNRAVDDLDSALIDGTWPSPLAPSHRTRSGLGLGTPGSQAWHPDLRPQARRRRDPRPPRPLSHALPPCAR